MPKFIFEIEVEAPEYKDADEQFGMEAFAQEKLNDLLQDATSAKLQVQMRAQTNLSELSQEKIDSFTSWCETKIKEHTAIVTSAKFIRKEVDSPPPEVKAKE